MRWFSAGQEAVGVVAIGQQATGVIAIGQLSTGVVAIGQLSRGVIVIGQLSVGVICIGQLAVGLGWVAGMLGIGALDGGALASLGLYGHLPFGALRRGRLGELRWQPGAIRSWWRAVVFAAIAALVVWVALAPVVHELVRVGGILREPPPPLR